VTLSGHLGRTLISLPNLSLALLNAGENWTVS